MALGGGPPVPPAQRDRDLGPGRGGQGHDVAVGHHRVGPCLDPGPGLLGAGHQSGRKAPGDEPQRIGASPRRALLGQLGDDLGHHIARRRQGQPQLCW
ncbi:MAG: hypothetical protein ACR2MO_09815 [Acidimicrobiales bacterium]